MMFLYIQSELLSQWTTKGFQSNAYFFFALFIYFLKEFLQNLRSNKAEVTLYSMFLSSVRPSGRLRQRWRARSFEGSAFLPISSLFLFPFGDVRFDGSSKKFQKTMFSSKAFEIMMIMAIIQWTDEFLASGPEAMQDIHSPPIKCYFKSKKSIPYSIKCTDHNDISIARSDFPGWLSCAASHRPAIRPCNGLRGDQGRFCVVFFHGFVGLCGDL